MHLLRSAIASILLTSTALAADPFAEFVRSADPKSPAEQAKTFHLPPGFTIELIAAEPDIGKPMNLAFDSRGRLWVTSTHEYPYPAKTEAEKKDTLKVIAFNDDGSVKSISTFAEKLDIPVGIYPITNGDSVIAFDINNVCRYSDTDGDGKSDKREVLYPGWGYERDTHGMASNFRRGFDGWLYGCHGFNNFSDVKGSDGQVMHLQSGNTYRMRLDGSHIEPFTIGQINPYGMSQDPLGNVYTSDSHSKPIYQLLRGGRYEAFDRNTDDGLGLAPTMMSHLHGSTAIAGSCFLATDSLPEEFRNNVLVGNVATCRINRDKLEFHGSTPKAIEQADFLSTDDSWFRPVNTVLGPDGAIYVADFYNRIIAHYEIKLDHPGRDYDRGRIWRINFKDNKLAKFDISKADVATLIEKLNHPNLIVRMLATDELSDRVGRDAMEPLTEAPTTATQKIHAMWVLHRLGALPPDLLLERGKDPDPSVRVHAMRVLSEKETWTHSERVLALATLAHPDRLLARCAADALGRHVDFVSLMPLLLELRESDAQDTHLVYTLKMAIRNNLRAPGMFDQLGWLRPDQVPTIAQIALAIESPEAAAFILDHIDALSADKAALTKCLRHAVRFASSPDVGPLAKLMQEQFADDLDLQLELYESIRQGLEQRGRPIDGPARQWGESLVVRVLQQNIAQSDWTSAPLDSTSAVVTPWAYEDRRVSGGQAKLLSTFPGGEQTTCVLKSKPFVIPAKLEFFLAGHNGSPDTTPTNKNVARLRAADTNEVLTEAPVPRNDTARRITWKLPEHEGRQAYLEFTDGDAGPSYAWLAFGKITPPVVAIPKVGLRTTQQRLQQAAKSAAEMKLASAAGDLKRVLLDHGNDTETRAAAANALAAMNASDATADMQQIVASSDEVMPLRTKLAAAMGILGADSAVIESFKTAPAELQTALATALASNTSTAAKLLDAVAAGKAPPRVLLDNTIKTRLAAAKVPDLDNRIKQLTKGVFAPKAEVEKEIAARRAAFRSASKLDPPAGQKLFVKNCQVCHQFDGQGGQIGPQLAGLSKRGVDRLIEDLLDPSRNVDPAFQLTHLSLKDGHLVSGQQKKTEGEVLVIYDQNGKEIQVPKKDVQQRIETKDSPMPSNFAEIISRDDFNNLMAYLLSK